MICIPVLVFSQSDARGNWQVAYANVNSGLDEGNPVVWNRGLAFISNRGRTTAGKYTDRATNDRFWRMYYVYDTAWVKSEAAPEWKHDNLLRPAVVRSSPNDSRLPAATRPPAEIPRNVKPLPNDKMPPFNPKMKDRFNEDHSALTRGKIRCISPVITLRRVKGVALCASRRWSSVMATGSR